jgi:hypothetical protein
MMFALGRPDVMPANDLGLIVATQHLLKLRQRPEPERLLKLSKPWRPWRTVAALFLWHFRRNMPDFSSSPAAQARREAERLAKEERKAARLAKAATQSAAERTAAKKAAAKKRTIAASRRKRLKPAAPVRGRKSPTRPADRS